MAGFKQNSEMGLTYEKSEYVKNNVFIGKAPEILDFPSFEDIKAELPEPVFEGHDDYILCYYKAWEIAFSNLCHPKEGTGFVSDFIDTAFNGCLFMWDSSFIMMFTKYAERIFPFQKTLDNFYALQHKDGFICREIIEETGYDQFTRFDISGTGPNILPLAEWLYFKNTGDTDRLRSVYAPLRAYHIWLRKHHTWRDGSYYSSGLGCGMDNLPRLKDGYDVILSDGKMIWVDICMQQLISADILIRMNEVLDGEDDVSDLISEKNKLQELINNKLWDENTKFYYDLWENDELSLVKHIGAYWGLLADIIPSDRLDGFICHLSNKNEFERLGGIPSLSADHPEYRSNGSYWRGGVWAPTNYMVLKGLTENGYHELAYKIGERYLKNVVEVYNKTGTLFENYSPDSALKGEPARADFVGWTGLAPISVFFEYVLGILPIADENTVIWNINRTERHGIKKYPFGKDATLDLICEQRSSLDDEPQLHITSTHPVKVIVRWSNGIREFEIK